MTEDVKGPRRYNNTGRAAAAEITRQAIVEAAAKRFLRDGYARTSIEAIAQDANVSPATIYKAFGTKAAILERVGDVAVAGDHEDQAVADRQWVQEALADFDGRRALRQIVEGSAAILRRITPIIEVVQAAAPAEPSLAELVERGDKGRRHNVRAFVATLHDHGQLRPGLSVDTGTDIVWALSSPATYAALVGKRGWEHDRFVDFVFDQLAYALLPGGR
jgi:AcrR family transcriptional regulator